MKTNTENNFELNNTAQASASENQSEAAVTSFEDRGVLFVDYFPEREEQLAMLSDMQPVIREVCRSAVRSKPVYEFFKRLFDIVFSLIGLILLSPVFLYVTIRIRRESPGPAFFKQKRVGKNGEPFDMFKFRSMYIDAEERLESMLSKNKGQNTLLFKVDNDERITPYGKKIRANSIDELPQLINILRGEMSFVGPRPPLVREVIQYQPEQTVRLAVKGGLTCYWQLTGRNDADFNFALSQDKKYLADRNFWLDVKLIFKTAFKVLDGESSGD